MPLQPSVDIVLVTEAEPHPILEKEHMEQLVELMP